MKYSACWLLSLISMVCVAVTAEEKVAEAGPTITQVSGEPFKDAVMAFEAAYAEAGPAFANAGTVKPDLLVCTKLSEKLDKAVMRLVQIHEDRLRPYGLEFHNKLELLETNSHRLKIGVLERAPADIEKYWSQLGTMRGILAATKAWR